jgi:signal transduction histidine kinase
MRRALALVALAVTSMVALAFLIPLGMVVQETARERAIADAQRQAGALAPVLAVTTDRGALDRALASTQAGAEQRVAVHLPNGGVVGVPRADPGRVRTAARRGRAFETDVVGGYALLQPVALDQAQIAVVEVFVPSADTTRGVLHAWAIMAGVAALLVIGSVLVADRLGARVVGSARRLAYASGALGSGDLSVRVEPSGPPELEEAGFAFNSMADRVVQLLAAEREMAADLSHRLRTPLAALRLNVGALPRGPATEQTQKSVERLEREIDAIIKIERRTAPDGIAGCDVVEVVGERVSFWSALAEDQGRTWTIRTIDGPVRVRVARAELAAVLDALLGNVFRYTEEGTPFGITLRVVRGHIGVIVSDAGPGIDDPRKAQKRGSSGGGSTGLGLDIARRVAESSGGELQINRSPQGGAQIAMWLRTIDDDAETWPRHRRRRRMWWRRKSDSVPAQ